MNNISTNDSFLKKRHLPDAGTDKFEPDLHKTLISGNTTQDKYTIQVSANHDQQTAKSQLNADSILKIDKKSEEYFRFLDLIGEINQGLISQKIDEDFFLKMYADPINLPQLNAKLEGEKAKIINYLNHLIELKFTTSGIAQMIYPNGEKFELSLYSLTNNANELLIYYTPQQIEDILYHTKAVYNGSICSLRKITKFLTNYNFTPPLIKKIFSRQGEAFTYNVKTFKDNLELFLSKGFDQRSIHLLYINVENDAASINAELLKKVDKLAKIFTKRINPARLATVLNEHFKIGIKDSERVIDFIYDKLFQPANLETNPSQNNSEPHRVATNKLNLDLINALLEEVTLKANPRNELTLNDSVTINRMHTRRQSLLVNQTKDQARLQQIVVEFNKRLPNNLINTDFFTVINNNIPPDSEFMDWLESNIDPLTTQIKKLEKYSFKLNDFIDNFLNTREILFEVLATLLTTFLEFKRLGFKVNSYLPILSNINFLTLHTTKLPFDQLRILIDLQFAAQQIKTITAIICSSPGVHLTNEFRYYTNNIVCLKVIGFNNKSIIKMLKEEGTQCFKLIGNIIDKTSGQQAQTQEDNEFVWIDLSAPVNDSDRNNMIKSEEIVNPTSSITSTDLHALQRNHIAKHPHANAENDNDYI